MPSEQLPLAHVVISLAEIIDRGEVVHRGERERERERMKELKKMEENEFWEGKYSRDITMTYCPHYM